MKPLSMSIKWIQDKNTGKKFSTVIFSLQLFGLIQEGPFPLSINLIYKESCSKTICDTDALLLHVGQHNWSQLPYCGRITETGNKNSSYYCDFATFGYYLPSKLHINILPNGAKLWPRIQFSERRGSFLVLLDTVHLHTNSLLSDTVIFLFYFNMFLLTNLSQFKAREIPF